MKVGAELQSFLDFEAILSDSYFVDFIDNLILLIIQFY